MRGLLKRLPWRESVQAQFIAVFMLLLLALLVLLNTYPLVAIRDLVFANKRSALQAQATVVAASLAGLDELTESGVEQVMELLDVVDVDRMLVTDASGRILYDTDGQDPAVGRYALFPELRDALDGDTAFYNAYADAAFLSRVAVPVRARGATIGAVYLRETDTEQGELLRQVQSTLLNISLGVAVAALLVTSVLTRALTRRLTQLVEAIRIVRDGEYAYRLDVKGEDELSELGREFNNLTQRLQSTEELRRRFVSDASHELKTPLASIRLLADSVVQSEAMDPETMREFVSDIGMEADRLNRTTEKLLQLTRMDGEAAPVRQPVELRAVVEKTLQLLAPLAREQEVDLRSELAPDVRVLGDPDGVYQIIFNLAENGIKYNVRGGSVSLRLFAREYQAVLEVEDTGIGIPEEDLPHIFDRFYRVDKARSRKSGGSGLGLSIVRDAVVRHGGQIRVEPNYPQGSRFVVEFPLYSGEEAAP